MHRRIESGAGLDGGVSGGYNRDVPACIARVLFFGRLKELVGVSEEAYELRDGVAIEQIFADYAERFPQLAAFRSSVVASHNREFATWETPVRSGDEVGFLPPVSGG
jgi:molybdopterin converting factor subunit 1